MRSRLINCPILLPTAVNIGSQPASGGRASRLKKLNTPRTCPSSRIGKANPLCKSFSPPEKFRGNSFSPPIFSIQTGALIAQTLPGKPSPSVNSKQRLAAANSSNCGDGKCHKLSRRKILSTLSIRHNSPNSKRKCRPIDSRICGAASFIVSSEARMRPISYSTLSRASFAVGAAESGEIGF